MTYRYIFLFLHRSTGCSRRARAGSSARTSGGEQRRWIAGTMGNLMNRSFKMSNDVYAAMARPRVQRRDAQPTTTSRCARADWLALAATVAVAWSRSLARSGGSSGDAPVPRPSRPPAPRRCRLRAPRRALRLPRTPDRARRRSTSTSSAASRWPCWAPTAAASRPCSSSSTGSSRRPTARCERWARTSPPSSTGRTPSASTARSASSSRTRTSSCSARPSSTTSPSARSSSGSTEERSRRAATRRSRQMEIAHLADRAPFELSGGEKKRAAIASVLSLRPERPPPRRADRLARSAHEVGPRQPHPPAGRGGQDDRHRDARARDRADHRGPGRSSSARTGASWPTARPTEILGDRDLLIRANLIHEHLHEHGGARHSHPTITASSTTRPGAWATDGLPTSFVASRAHGIRRLGPSGSARSPRATAGDLMRAPVVRPIVKLPDLGSGAAHAASSSRTWHRTLVDDLFATMRAGPRVGTGRRADRETTPRRGGRGRRPPARAPERRGRRARAACRTAGKVACPSRISSRGSSDRPSWSSRASTCRAIGSDIVAPGWSLVRSPTRSTIWPANSTSTSSTRMRSSTNASIQNHPIPRVGGHRADGSQDG